MLSVERAEALEGLASLLQAGLSVQAALEAWPDALPAERSGNVVRSARLSRLGAPLEEVVAGMRSFVGHDADGVASAFALHASLGIDPVPLLLRAAELARRRAEFEATGRAAVAGAKLSGGLVGGLPLVALPLVPMARAPLFDAAGAAILFFGLVLTAAGMYWMLKLVPRVDPRDEPVALFLDHVVAALRAGSPLDVAMNVTSATAPPPVRTRLGIARRRTILGQTWADALEDVDPTGWGSVAAALRRAERLGTPPAPSLEACARMRRAAAAVEFERELRRAPVLMVLPLVLCVLPAFGLLAIVPFLRGLAFA